MLSIDDIKKLVKENKFIIGYKENYKALNSGKVKEIFMCSNPKKEIEDDLKHYCKISKVKLTKLPYPNDELGTMCKKPFAISVLGLKE